MRLHLSLYMTNIAWIEHVIWSWLKKSSMNENKDDIGISVSESHNRALGESSSMAKYMLTGPPKYDFNRWINVLTLTMIFALFTLNVIYTINVSHPIS